MATAPVLAILARPENRGAGFPPRALAAAIVLVLMAAGYFVPLHLLGILNIFFGHPRITPATVILAWACGLCIAGLAMKRSGVIQRPEVHSPDVGAPVKLTLAFLLVLCAVFLLNELFSFPNGYDPIAYHIDVVLKWLQQGNIQINPALGWRYSLPSNAELPAILALAVGVPGAVAIGNLFAALLLAISVYLIAWKTTRAAAPALIAAMTALTIPMVIYQTFELTVDLFGTAFLTAAVALLIWSDRNVRLCAFLSGYAAGLAIGTKPVFWVYGALFAVGAFLTILRMKNARLRFAALLAGGMVLASGFWFLRAAVGTGNPLYPMRVSIGAFEIFPGYARTLITPVGYGISSLRMLLVQPWTEAVPDTRLPVGFDRGTGPLFAAIVLPGLLFTLLRIIRRQASVLERSLLLAVAAGFLLWSETLLRVPRFAMPLLVLSCALAAPMLQVFLLRKRHPVIFLCLAGMLLNGIECLSEPAQRTLYRIRRRDFTRATYYGYPPVIDQLPPGSKVLDETQGRKASFLLAGASLANYVLPSGDPRTADYVAKEGPADQDDAVILADGAKLIYDAFPFSFYPKVAQRWRIYRMH